MTPVPSATQWGCPTAPNRALLIHGNTSSSHTWERVARGLAKAGFFVTAPNMLGHGNRHTDDFHLHTFAQDLYSTYFADGMTYDLIIGHSLGGTVTLALLPLLEASKSQNNANEKVTTKTAVILVDPGIEASDQALEEFEKKNGAEIRHVRSVEAYWAEHPTWTRTDVVSRVVGLHLAQSELPKLIFKHIKPFAYRHLFHGLPPHVEMSVLIADPKLGALCPPELVPSHPQIRRVITVSGSGHWIQHEDPEVVVKTALEEVERLRPYRVVTKL